MNPERDASPSDVRLFVMGEDGAQVQVGEFQTIEAVYQPAQEVPLQEVQAQEVPLQEVQAQEAPAPAAMPEALAVEEPELTDVQKLMVSFANVPEGNLYSREINEAIEIIADATSMQEVIRLVESRPELNFKQLLFRQVDQEGKDLNNFMYQLQRIPSLPSLDVDFI